jgi:hypothetical protein
MGQGDGPLRQILAGDFSGEAARACTGRDDLLFRLTAEKCGLPGMGQIHEH